MPFNKFIALSIALVLSSASAQDIRAAGVYGPADLPRNAEAAVTPAPFVIRSLLLSRETGLDTFTWAYPAESAGPVPTPRAAVIVVPRDSEHPDPTTVTVPLTVEPKVPSVFPRNPQASFSCPAGLSHCECSPRAPGCPPVTTFTITATMTRDTDRPCDIDPSLCKRDEKTEVPAVTLTATIKK